jgi:alcohol/geraniol dehydrogenase (NADP+)
MAAWMGATLPPEYEVNKALAASLARKLPRAAISGAGALGLQCRHQGGFMIHGYAAEKAKGPLKPFEYSLGPLAADEVEINVNYCGICHSDLSMVDNDFGFSQYPLVPGHEVAGVIGQMGGSVKHLKIGQSVGLGWYSGSCMTCPQCMSGNHNLCPTKESTIVGRHGGFADKVRCKATWATPLIEGIDPAKAGPLFCGGITVFNPMVQFDIKPTDRVGVIGIGGLGHLALQFLNKWGCDVTAFSSNIQKHDETMKLGAHRVVNSRNDAELKAIAGQLDFVISTVNAPLNWGAYLSTLNPKGRLHFVGAVLEPISTSVFPLLTDQLSISGSPLGSPATTAKMLEFCARHQIEPVVETFPMSKINDAMEHLRAGKARYRIVLKRD